MQTNANGLLETIVALSAPTQKTVDSALWFRPRVMLVLYRDGKKPPVILPTGKRLFPDFENKMFMKITLPDSLREKQYKVRWALESSFTEPSVNSRAYTLVNGRIPQ
jgi:hypothetical protein